MNFTRILLSFLALAVMLAANLRLVFSVSGGEEALPGTYSLAQLRQAEERAAAICSELSRAGAEAPELAARPHLSLRPPEGGDAALLAACLESAEGLSGAWAVEADGVLAGIVADPTAMGEALEVMLASRAVREAVTVSFTDKITFRRVFVPEGCEDDVMAVARELRGITEVMSVTADGTVRYG